jgi:NADH-quinone oxidoreductase subunit A
MSSTPLSSDFLTAHASILVMLLASVAFAAGGLIFWLIISPRRKSAEKITTYECGEEPVGTAWVQLNIRFYVVALIFIIFDVEAAFLIPWAVVFRQMDSLIQVALIEGLVFILILAVALAYVWRKGDLAWVRPEDKA